MILILASFVLLMTPLISSLIRKPDIHPRSSSSTTASIVPRLCYEIDVATNHEELTPLNEFCFACLAEKNSEIEHCKVCNRCVKHFHLHSRLFNQCFSDTNIRPYLLFQAMSLVQCALYLYVLGGIEQKWT